MPLPTAPAKRAALLSEQDYNVPARAQAKMRKMESSLPYQADTEQKPRMLKASDIAEVTAPSADFSKKTAPESSSKPQRASSSARKTRPATEAPTLPTPKKPKHSGPTKIFVLDTNVLLHDPMCLFRFEEHDIFLPMIVLEELDAHKKGMTEVARNARQTSRTLDALAGLQGADITTGLPLNTTGYKEAGGKLFFQTQLLNYTLPTSLPQGKADNQILGVVEALRVQHAAAGCTHIPAILQVQTSQ